MARQPYPPDNHGFSKADVVNLNTCARVLGCYLSSEMSTAVVPSSCASKVWGASPG